MYWFDYVPDRNSQINNHGVFSTAEPVNMLGRSIRCSYNDIVFKPWCVERMKLVLYYENIPLSKYIKSEPSIDVDTRIHLSYHECNGLRNILLESIEISDKLIKTLCAHTFRSYHDNHFAYEIRDDYVNILHVVDDIFVDREQLIDALMELRDSFIDHNLLNYLNIDRYIGRIHVDNSILGIPLPYTRCECLPFLIIPKSNVVRQIIHSVNKNEPEYKHKMNDHFRKMIDDTTKLEYGNCYNYMVSYHL